MLVDNQELDCSLERVEFYKLMLLASLYQQLSLQKLPSVVRIPTAEAQGEAGLAGTEGSDQELPPREGVTNYKISLCYYQSPLELLFSVNNL